MNLMERPFMIGKENWKKERLIKFLYYLEVFVTLSSFLKPYEISLASFRSYF